MFENFAGIFIAGDVVATHHLMFPVNTFMSRVFVVAEFSFVALGLARTVLLAVMPRFFPLPDVIFAALVATLERAGAALPETRGLSFEGVVAPFVVGLVVVFLGTSVFV